MGLEVITQVMQRIYPIIGQSAFTALTVDMFMMPLNILLFFLHLIFNHKRNSSLCKSISWASEYWFEEEGRFLQHSHVTWRFYLNLKGCPLSFSSSIFRYRSKNGFKFWPCYLLAVWLGCCVTNHPQISLRFLFSLQASPASFLMHSFEFYCPPTFPGPGSLCTT